MRSRKYFFLISSCSSASQLASSVWHSSSSKSFSEVAPFAEAVDRRSIKAAREKARSGAAREVLAEPVDAAEGRRTRLGLVVRGFLGGGELVRVLVVVLTVAASCRFTPVAGGVGGIVGEGRRAGASRTRPQASSPLPLTSSPTMAQNGSAAAQTGITEGASALGSSARASQLTPSPSQTKQLCTTDRSASGASKLRTGQSLGVPSQATLTSAPQQHAHLFGPPLHPSRPSRRDREEHRPRRCWDRDASGRQGRSWGGPRS